MFYLSIYLLLLAERSILPVCTTLIFFLSPLAGLSIFIFSHWENLTRPGEGLIKYKKWDIFTQNSIYNIRKHHHRNAIAGGFVGYLIKLEDLRDFILEGLYSIPPCTIPPIDTLTDTAFEYSILANILLVSKRMIVQLNFVSSGNT